MTVANTHGPGSILELAKESGSVLTVASLQDEVAADVVILAVPFAAHRTIAQARNGWEEPTVIDTMNFREESLAPLGGLQCGDSVAKSFPGAKVVKTFNQLPAALLASSPDGDGGNRVMYVVANRTLAKMASTAGS